MVTSSKQINPKAGPLSERIYTKGVHNLPALLEWIRNQPYGRNSDRTNYSLVIEENKGSCSTKHALVKAIAEENNWPDVDLYIGFFFMNGELFPKLTDLFEEHKLEGIPEAHTFLVIEDEYVDVTGLNSPIEEDLIVDEIEIQPQGIGDLKISLHKGFIEDWAEEEEISLPLDQLWAIREACINKLSQA